MIATFRLVVPSTHPRLSAAALMVALLAVLPSITTATNLPMTPSGTLALQLDADSGLAVNATGVVQSWNDLSGNGGNFAYASGDPTVVPNAFNNQSVVRFTGTAGGTDRLYLTNASYLQSNLSGQQLTLFAVTRNTTSLDGLFETYSGEYDNLRAAFGTVQIPGTNGPAWSGTAAGSVDVFRLSLEDDPSTPEPTLVEHFQTFRLDASGETLLGSVYTDYTSTGEGFGAFDLGNIDSGSTASLTGDLAEFVLYKGALTDTDRVAVENTLARSYGIVPEPSVYTMIAAGIGLLLATWRHGLRFLRG